MGRSTVERLLERSKSAFQEIDANRTFFEDAYEYIMPWRNTFYRENTKTHNEPSIQFDSTAQIAAQNFVNTMQSNFTPVFSRWAELKSGPNIPEEFATELDQELEHITKRIFSFLDASNFSTAVSECYFDLGIGTMALWVMEGDETQPLNFIPQPLSQIAVEDGKLGGVGAVYRRHNLKARLIEQRFDDAKISQDLRSRMNDKPDDDIELFEATYYDPENLMWYYDVIWEEGRDRLVEREYAEMPVIVTRWMKVPGFATGIGPFMLAMADYKTLNKMKELQLQLASLNVFGIYTVKNSSVFNPNTAPIRPGAFLPVESNGADPSIQRLPTTGNFQIQEFMMRELQDQIRQVMLDNRLPPESAPVRTAFEIAERIKELQTDIGASFGRLMFEFVQPLFRRMISILEDKGLIQMPEGIQLDQITAQISIVSPIAQQQATDDIQKFLRSFQIVQQVSPELALASFDIHQIPQWISDKLGSDSELLRSEDEMNELMQKLVKAVEANIQSLQTPSPTGIQGAA